MSMNQNANVRSSMRRRPSQIGKVEKASDPKNALFRLLPYLLPHKWKLILAFLFVIFFTLLGLLGPYLMGVAIDTFIAGGDIPGLIRISFYMLAAYIGSNLFFVLPDWIMARVAQDALKKLRHDLFTHLQSKSMSFFDSNPAGGLMSRLTSDIDAINQTVSQNITTLFASVLSMVGVIITMFVLNHWLALTTLLVIPLMLWFTTFVARYTRRGFRSLQKSLGGLNAITEEAISGQKVIKAFGRKETVIAEFRRQNEAVYKAGVYANSYAMLLMPLTAVLGNFFVIVLAGFGGWLALKGLVTVGVIATFINYGQNFIRPLRQIANLFNVVQGALAGAERVFEIIDTPVEIQDSPHAISLEHVRGDVSMQHVDFSYVPGIPVIKNMSLEVKAGQTVALVGPTGAGKTTIINLFNRFYELENGSIQIDGHDLRDLCKANLRQHLGIVLQDTFLFADTVMENIRYGRLDASDEECIEAAKMADADHFIRQLPEGYQTNLSERAGNLSQGQRQLLSIARAILVNPAILILDEATSSVDTRTEARIQQSLLRLMEGRTSFVIAHRLSTIRDADLVVVINEGQIIEQGTHDELLEKKGFFHHLYVSQFKGNAI